MCSKKFGIRPEEVVPGADVYYYHYISDSDHSEPVKTKFCGMPWQLSSGDWVVRVENVVGGVSLDHLSFNRYV
jgi:hypothetical protein